MPDFIIEKNAESSFHPACISQVPDESLPLAFRNEHRLVSGSCERLLNQKDQAAFDAAQNLRKSALELVCNSIVPIKLDVCLEGSRKILDIPPQKK